MTTPTRPPESSSSGPWLETQHRYMTESDVRLYGRIEGLDIDEAAKWADADIGPYATERALKEGLTIEEVLDRRRRAKEAEKWAGFSALAKHDWLSRGFDRDEAQEWRGHRWTATAAAVYRRAGIPLDLATEWAPLGSTTGQLSIDEFVEFVAAGISVEDAKSGRTARARAAGLAAHIVWGRWRTWYVVADATSLVTVIRRRRLQSTISRSSTVAQLRRECTPQQLDRELGWWLDLSWQYGYVPLPGEDLIPPRPVGWLPRRIPLDVRTRWPHPLDQLSLHQRVDDEADPASDTGWPCLFRQPMAVIRVAEHARSAGFSVSRRQRLVDRVMADRR